MFSLFTSRKKTVSIVITDEAIHMVELKQANPLQISQWKERSLPKGVVTEGIVNDHRTLTSILDECILEWKIRKKNVQFLVPDEYVHIRKVLIPRDVQADELKNFIFLEIGSTIHLPFQDPVYDAVPVGHVDDKQEVLVIASKEEIVKSYEESLKSASLNPIAADISPLALYRLYNQRSDNIDVHLMIFHLESNKATISVFYKSEPLFMRPIALEREAEFTESEFEDLYEEIVKILNFYRYTMSKGGAEVEKILFAGSHPDYEEIKDYLKTRLTQHCEDLVSRPYRDMAGNDIPSSFHAALGLALKEVR